MGEMWNPWDSFPLDFWSQGSSTPTPYLMHSENMKGTSASGTSGALLGRTLMSDFVNSLQFMKLTVWRLTSQPAKGNCAELQPHLTRRIISIACNSSFGDSFSSQPRSKGWTEMPGGDCTWPPGDPSGSIHPCIP